MNIRKEPTVYADRLGKPYAIPERDVGELKESLKQNESFDVTPDCGLIEDDLEQFYVNARLEHAKMLQERDLLMQHKEMQAKINECRIKELKESQDDLRDTFITVNMLLREFGEKRNEGIRKRTAHRNQQQAMQDQSINAQAVFREFKTLLQQLQATAEEYAPYEKVLKDVVEKKRAFKSVKELMDQCDALMFAQVEVNAITDKKVMEMEMMRQRMVTVAREAALEVLGLKNKLAVADRVYLTKRTEVLKWERILRTARDSMIAIAVEKHRMREGINHLYNLLCQRRDIPPELAYKDVEGRMGFLMDEVKILQESLGIQLKQNPKTEAKKNSLC